MLNLFKKKKKDVAAEPSDEDKKIGRYWFNCVDRSLKAQPTEHWKAAEKRYSVTGYNPEDPTTDTERPFVNDTRKLHESSLAFLDQQDPSFKVSPTEPWLGDEIAEKQAECESKYLKYLWREQKCQKVESRKLNDGLLINNGDTLVEFNLKKWMPSLRYIPQRDVLKDPDCGGLGENGNWEGYREDVPIEEFKSWHPDLDNKVFAELEKKAGSVLDETQREVLSEEDKPLYKTVKVVHIFARNSAAIRQTGKNEEEREVSKPLAEELQLDTPRRYIQLVHGWPAPVMDEDYWPLDLDHDEFPLTHLQFNQLNNSLYGFTDHQQMERLDELSDDIMLDLGIAAYWASVQKFGGSAGNKVNPKDIEDFLNNPNTSYLDDIFDAGTGNLKIRGLDRGEVKDVLIGLYGLVHDQAKEASAMSELLQSPDIQALKEVTALGIRVADANAHQRVNRRMSGPWGYEQSIAEDAVKMLEVAHQFVPNLSSVAVMEATPVIDPVTNTPILDDIGGAITEEKEILRDLPWPEALKAMGEGGSLIKLGIDAIVGPELAQFWPYKMPPKYWKLSTKVTVEPGTTRSITKEQQVAVLKQLYLEVYQPFYQVLGRLDLAREFIEIIGRLANVPAGENLLPEPDWVRQQMQILQQMQAAEAAGAPGQAGGQPLNSPEASGGEVQTGQEQSVGAI